MDLAKKFRAAYKLTEMYNMWLAARAEILKNTESNIFVFGIFSVLTIIACFVQSSASCLLTFLLFLTYLLWASRFRYIYLKKIGEIFTPKFKSLLSEMECEHFSGDLIDENAENRIKRALKNTFDLYVTALTEELNKHGKAFETEINEITFVGDRDSEIKIMEVANNVRLLIQKYSESFGLKPNSSPSVLYTRTMSDKHKEICYLHGYTIFNLDLKIKII